MAEEQQGREGITIHEGPMADSHGTEWREQAAKLEELNQRRVENPMQTLPDSMTTIDKAHAWRSKSDEGTVDKTDNAVGGDHISTRDA